MSFPCPVYPSCLGMCDWTDCLKDIDRAHPKVRAELPGHTSASSTNCLEKPQPLGEASRADVPIPPLKPQRFNFVSNEELSALSKGVVPVNTDKSTKWALSNFEAWRSARNVKHPTDQVPDDLFMCTDPATLNTQLSRFVLETRKSNGKNYPPKTLHQLLCGILRHMRSTNPACPNFLEKKDSRFKPLHGVMDSHFHQLHTTGIGRETKHAKVLSKEDEEKLWRSGVMGTTTPKALQNAAFYLVGKMFSLRGGVELRNVRISQIK